MRKSVFFPLVIMYNIKRITFKLVFISITYAYNMIQKHRQLHRQTHSKNIRGILGLLPFLEATFTLTASSITLCVLQQGQHALFCPQALGWQSTHR